MPDSLRLNQGFTPKNAEQFKKWLFSDNVYLDGETLKKTTGSENIESLINRYKVDVFSDNHSAFDCTWYAGAMQLLQANHEVQQDTSVLIAIIDTGIFFEHSSLRSSVFINKQEVANQLDSDNNGFEDDIYGYDFVSNRGITRLANDDNGHGTAMGFIAAGRNISSLTPLGVNQTAKLLSVKAFDSFGFGNSLDIARAIVYATDRGAEIINLSFGDVFKSLLIESAVKYAWQKGAILVGSGGNVGGNSLRYPAAFPEVIAVSWLNKRLRINATANYGPHIQFAAPGSEIKHAAIGNQIAFTTSSGSSASAALVSGVFSWMKSMLPNADRNQLLNMVSTTTLDTESPGIDQYTGLGMPLLYSAWGGETSSIFAEFDLLQMNSSSISFQVSALGSGIKDWEIRYVRGRDIQAESYLMQTESRLLVSDSLRLNFDKSEFSNQTLTFFLQINLWNGSRQVRTKTITIPPTSIEINEFSSAWSIKANSIAYSSIIETDVLGLVSGSLHSDVNENVWYSKSDREAYVHVLSYDEPENGALIQEISFNYSGENSQIELNHKLEKKPVFTPHNYVKKEFETEIQQAWTLNYQNNSEEALLNFYQMFSNTEGYFIQVSENEGIPQNNTELIKILGRFIPKSIYKNDEIGIFWLLAYGGGKIFLFDINQNYKPIETDVFGNFVFAGLIDDTDSDANPEIWAHNRSQLSCFEYENGAFLQKFIVDNSSTVETNLVTNEFQVPDIIAFENLNSFKDVFLGDYDGDIFQIKTSGNDNWSLKTIYEGNYYGTGNVLKSVYSTSGKSYLFTIRHSFPFIDENRTKQTEFVQVEWYRFENDSLSLVEKLMFTEVDLGFIDAVSIKKDTVVLVTSPNVYEIISDFDHEKPIQFSTILQEKNLDMIGVQQNGILSKRYDLNTLTYHTKSKIELPIFSVLPKIYQIDIPAFSDSLLLTFVSSKNEEFELFTNDTLVQTIQTKAEKTVIIPIINYKTELIRIQNGNRQSVFLHQSEALLISPSEIAVQNDQFIRVSLQENVFRFNNLSQNELPFSVESIIPISRKEYVIRPNLRVTKEIEIQAYFTGLISETGIPIYFKNETLTFQKKQTIFLSSFEIEDKNTVKIFLKTGNEVQISDLIFSSELNSEELLIKESVFSSETKIQFIIIQIPSIDLQNYGKPVKILAELSESASLEYQFKPSGNQISVRYQRAEDEFGINDAISFPSPWVISKQINLQFAHLPIESSILILDNTGRPVIELQSTGFTGSHEWNGKNAAGNTVSSGIYFYQVIAGTKRSKLKKIAIIR